MKNYKLNQIVLPALLSIGVIVLLIFYIVPTVLNIVDSVSKISTLDKNIAVYQNNIDKLSLIVPSSIKTKSLEQSKTIPLTAEIATLENQVFAIARGYGLSASEDLAARLKEAEQNKQSPSTLTDTDIKNKKVLNLDDLASGEPDNVPSTLLISGIVYPFSMPISVSGDKDTILQFVTSLYDSKVLSRLVSIQNVKFILAPSLNGKASVGWGVNMGLYSYGVYQDRTVKKSTLIVDPKSNELLKTPLDINTSF